MLSIRQHNVFQTTQFPSQPHHKIFPLYFRNIFPCYPQDSQDIIPFDVDLIPTFQEDLPFQKLKPFGYHTIRR